MAFIQLHAGVPGSPKHAPLSDAAFRLWTHALCWSKEHLTDGFVPSEMLPKLHQRGPRVVGELLRTIVPGKGPLWHQVEGGYRIHDYAEWQETKERVQGRRQQWRDRQARKRVTTKDVTPSVTRDSRVSHANPPSDVSGVDKKERDAHVDHGASPVLRRRTGLIHESAIGVDVTEAMHAGYVARVNNMGIPDADRVLRAFYHVTEQEWRGKDTGRAWPFWDARVDDLLKKRGPARTIPFAWTCKACGEVHEATRERAQSGWCPRAGAA